MQGKHVGQIVVERYVDDVTAGIEATSVHTELTQMLEDDCTSDVADLVELYTAFGGADLDDTYRRPPNSID